MPLAALAPALIMGAGAVAGGAIAASASKSAAKTQAAAADNAAATQMQMYQQTRSDLAPYMTTGNAALSQLANLFGLSTPGATTGSTGTTGPQGGGSTSGGGIDYAQVEADRPDVVAEYNRVHAIADRNSPNYTARGLDSLTDYIDHWANLPPTDTYQIPRVAPTNVTAGGATSSGGTSGVPNATAVMSALTQFPGYQFGLDQGVQALDRSAASRGLLLSGGQLKDTQQFGTNYALQQAWNPYVSQLNSMATSGQNAAAGVGTAGTATASGVAQSQLAAGQATAAGTVGAANGLTTGLNGALTAYQLSQTGYTPSDWAGLSTYGAGSGGGGSWYSGLGIG